MAATAETAVQFRRSDDAVAQQSFSAVKTGTTGLAPAHKLSRDKHPFIPGRTLLAIHVFVSVLDAWRTMNDLHLRTIGNVRSLTGAAEAESGFREFRNIHCPVHRTIPVALYPLYDPVLPDR